jgi:hypothetical protein
VPAETRVVYIGPKKEIESDETKKARLDRLAATKKARMDRLAATKKARLDLAAAKKARMDELAVAKKARLDRLAATKKAECNFLEVDWSIGTSSFDTNVEPEDDDPQAAARAAVLAAVYADFQMLCDGGARVEVAITGLASMGSDGQVDTACSVKPGQLK